jgi:hypothetical protein
MLFTESLQTRATEKFGEKRLLAKNLSRNAKGSFRFVNIPGFHPSAVQLFPQMYALEDYPMTDFMAQLSEHLRPETLTITIRYTDWWYWEGNYKLVISSDWMRNIKVPRCLERIIMEFETRNGKKDELDALVKGPISKWRFRVEDKLVEGPEGKMVSNGETEWLVLSNEKPVASTWVGSSSVGGIKYAHHSQDQNGDVGSDEDMLYYIVKVVWKRERPAPRRWW